jgi:hypothetical protein
LDSQWEFPMVKRPGQPKPDQIEAKELRIEGFRTPIGSAFSKERYEIVDFLLKMGAKNPVWHLLHNSCDLKKSLELIETYANIKTVLQEDLTIMNNLGLLKSRKYVRGISNLIKFYIHNDEITKLIESILENCDLFKRLDVETESLLWNDNDIFLASIFFYAKIKEKISISNQENKLKVCDNKHGTYPIFTLL